MFTKIEQPDILDKIVGQIKENIAAGRLQKGDRLPSERQLVETFGLSRATIREAIKALEMLGLVDCAHGSGNYISSNLSQSLSEPLSIMFLLERGTEAQTYQLRRSLEFATVGLAARYADSRESEVLLALCEAVEGGRTELEKTSLDRQLHMEIARASKNPLLITLLNACETLIEANITGARAQIIRRLSNDNIINVEHREIVEAIIARDIERAERAMLKHMDTVAEFTE